MDTQRTGARNALTALLRTLDLGIEARSALTAAQVTTVQGWRVRSEAAFAALAGASPIPASSGNTNRHRLNRYGDRQLNRALDVVARTRSLADPATRAYIECRTAEGKCPREIRRCLKRFIARQILRQLQTLVA